MNDPCKKIIELSRGEGTRVVSVLAFDELDSTNNYAKSVACVRSPEPFVVRARFQRKGRGRYDRVWVSPAHKNLLFSIVVYPRSPVSKTPLLTMITAQAIIDVLAPQIKGCLSIKKPNDVLYNGKKIAGILTEQESVGTKSSFVVIGIGLNINATAEEVPSEATSLLAEEGTQFDLESVFEELVRGFFHKYEKEF